MFNLVFLQGIILQYFKQPFLKTFNTKSKVLLKFMRKIFLLTALFMFMTVSAFAQTTVLQVRDAFMLSFEAFRNARVIAGVGLAPEGVKVKDEEVIFEEADIYFLAVEKQGKYKTITGKAVKESESVYSGEFTLTGGAVTKIKWTLVRYNSGESIYTANINADGQKLIYSLNERII